MKKNIYIKAKNDINIEIIKTENIEVKIIK